MTACFDIRQRQYLARNAQGVVIAVPCGVEVADHRRDGHGKIRILAEHFVEEHFRGRRPLPAVPDQLGDVAPAIAVDVAVEEASPRDRRRVRLGQIVGGEYLAKELEGVQIPLTTVLLRRERHEIHVSGGDVAAPRADGDEFGIGRRIPPPPGNEIRADARVDLPHAGKLRQDIPKPPLEIEHAWIPVGDRPVVCNRRPLAVIPEPQARPEGALGGFRRGPPLQVETGGDVTDDEEALAAVYGTTRPVEKSKRIFHGVRRKPREDTAHILHRVERRQRLANIVELHHQSQMVERHRRELVDLVKPYLLLVAAVVQREDHPGYRLHCLRESE